MAKGTGNQDFCVIRGLEIIAIKSRLYAIQCSLLVNRTSTGKYVP